jgi:hypothetical protein
VKQKRPQKKTRREKKRFKKKTVLMVISSIIVLGSFLYAMNHPYFAIEKIEIIGQKTIIENDIHISIENYLSHKIFGIIPRNNILFINTRAIERHLREQFTKIEDLSVETINGERILVTIGERSVHSLWCLNKEYESVFDEECYFADSFGLLYARAPYFSGTIYKKLFIDPLYTTLLGEEFVESTYIGTSVSTVESFPDFFEFIDQLETQFSVQTGAIRFDSFDDVFIDITRLGTQTYHQEQKPIIKYNQLTDYKTISRDINIALEFDSFKEDFTSRPTALESIDVRFDNRAFYTFTPPVISEE